MSSVSVRRLLPHLIAVCALCCLVVVSALLWMEWKERFPQVERGVYSGRVEGIFGDSEGARLFVESFADGRHLFFAVLRDGWAPSFISLVAKRDSGSNQPVVVSNGVMQLKFQGSRVERGRYAGTVVDTQGGEDGIWSLTPLRNAPQEDSEEDRRTIELRLSLKAEVDATEGRLNERQSKVSEQQVELKHLEEFITKGENLRSKADEKYVSVANEAKELAGRLKAKRLEAEKIQSQIELSQKVTSMGKLVSLSRDSLEKDQRWIESMLSSSAGALSQEMQGEIERSHRIADLRAQIETEREKILRLREQLRNRGADNVGDG